MHFPLLGWLEKHLPGQVYVWDEGLEVQQAAEFGQVCITALPH